VTELEAADAAEVPTALVAVTVNVYAVPLVSPVIVAVDRLPATVTMIPLGFVPSGLDLTVYPVIAELPLFVGAVHVTIAEVFPPVAVPMVGAPGIVGGEGVTCADAADAADIPIAFVAVTVNVYTVPFVRPVTVAEVLNPDAVAVIAPGLDVTVYPVIADPPLLLGTDHDTVAL
jgi:hypothetical protein